MNELQGKTYAVTGASKGFGLAIVKALLAHGANVAMLARNEAALQAAAAELNTEKIIAITADVANWTEVRDALLAAKSHFGSFNGIINNAGLARPGNVEDLDYGDLMLQVNTNFVGTVLCCQAAIPLLRGEDNPRIVNISSASAWHYDEIYHLSIYASTKAAVERFTRDLRLELQQDNIGVTCIRPGAAATNFADGWDMDRVTKAINAWQNSGPTMDTGMEQEHVAAAVVHSLSYPAGVAVDLLEVRPNQSTPKLKL